MKIKEIREKPTIVTGDNLHQSLTRCYHILNKVKELLAKETPPDVVLEIIEECEFAPGVEVDYRDKSGACSPILRVAGQGPYRWNDEPLPLCQ